MAFASLSEASAASEHGFMVGRNQTNATRRDAEQELLLQKPAPKGPAVLLKMDKTGPEVTRGQ